MADPRETPDPLELLRQRRAARSTGAPAPQPASQPAPQPALQPAPTAVPTDPLELLRRRRRAQVPATSAPANPAMVSPLAPDVGDYLDHQDAAAGGDPLGDDPANYTGTRFSDLRLPPAQGQMRQQLGIDPVLPMTRKKNTDEYGVDVAKWRREYAQKLYRNRRRDQEALLGRDLTTEERRELVTASFNDAHKEIHAVMANSHNTAAVFLDDTPETSTQQLDEEGWLPFGLHKTDLGDGVMAEALEGFSRRDDAAQLAAPIGAWLSPYIQRTYEPVLNEATGHYEAKYGDSYERQGFWGWLQWVMQPSAFNFAATAAEAGYLREAKGEIDLPAGVLNLPTAMYQGYSTDEHLDAIRKGKDLGSYAEQLGDYNPAYAAAKVAGVVDDDSYLGENLGFHRLPINWKILSGIGLALGLSLVDFDAFALGGVVGKGGRALGEIGTTGVALGRQLPAAMDFMSHAGRIERQRDAVTAQVKQIDGLLDRVDLDGLPAGAQTAGAALHKDADYMDAASTVSRTQDTLKRVNPVLAASVESQFKAQVGGGSAASKMTRATIEKALEARAALEKVKLQHAAEARAAAQTAQPLAAAANAGRNTPTPAPQKGWTFDQYQGPAAQAIARAEVNTARLAHMADEMVVQDLKAMQSQLQKMGMDHKGKATAAARQRLITQGQKVATDLARERRIMTLQAGTKAGRTAQARHDAARKVWRSLMEESVRLMGDDAAGMLQTMKAAALKKAQTSYRATEALLEAAGKAGHIDGAKTWKNHTQAVTSAQRHISADNAGQALIGMYKNALQRHAESLDAYATMLRAGDKLNVPDKTQVLRETLAAIQNTSGPTPTRPLLDALLKHYDPDDLWNIVKAAHESEGGVDAAPAAKLLADLLQGADVTLPPGGLRGLVDSLHKVAEGRAMGASKMARALESREPWVQAIQMSVQRWPIMKSVTRWTLGLRKWAKEAAANDYLGAGNVDMTQIGKGMLDQARVFQKEIVDIAETVGANNAAAVFKQYLTDPGFGGNIAQALSNAMDAASAEAVAKALENTPFLVGSSGQTSLYDDGLEFLRGMLAADPEEELAALKGIAHAWLPSGVDTKGLSGQLIQATRKAILDNPGLTFDELSRVVRMKTVQATSRTGQAFPGAMTMADEAGELLGAEGARATALLAQNIGQAALLQRGTRQLAGQLAGLSDDLIERAVRYSEFDVGASGEGYEAMLEVFTRLGLPPKLREQTAELGKTIRAGMRYLKGGQGRQGTIVPAMWMTAIEKQMGRIIKETSDFNATQKNPLLRSLGDTAMQLGRLFRASITTGVLMPTPSYYINMAAGNFGQIWAEAGLRQGLKTAALGGKHTIEAWSPQWLRKPITQGAKFLGAKVDQGVGAVLGQGAQAKLHSLTNALMNPHVSAFFDPRMAPDSVRVLSPSGEAFTLGQLRELAMREGVLTSYASTDLMGLVRRATGAKKGAAGLADAALDNAAYKVGGVVRSRGRALKKMLPQSLGGEGLTYWEKRGEMFAAAADAVEQRQRVAMFTDLVVNKGLNPRVAGTQVREALYDWGHAMTEIEAETIQKYALFYRFWKLAFRQGARILLDPFHSGNRFSGRMMGVPYRQDMVGRLRAMNNSLAGVRDAAQSQWDMDRLAEEDETAWAMSQIHPWWTQGGGKVSLAAGPADAEKQAHYLRNRGKRTTHTSIVMPSTTPLDVTGQLLMNVGLLASWAAGERTMKDVGRTLTEQMADMAGPLHGPMLKGLADYFGLGVHRPEGRGVPIRRTETAILGVADHIKKNAPILRNMGLKPWLGNRTQGRTAKGRYDKRSPGDEGGMVRAPAPVVALLRMTPVLGTEMTRWIDPLVENWDREAKDRAVMALLSSYTGLFKEYPANPEVSEGYRVKFATQPAKTEQSQRARWEPLQIGDERDIWGRKRSDPE